MKNILGCLAAGVLLAGCADRPNDTPKAETTIKVDIDDTKDSIKDALNEAGDKIEDGAEKARAKLDRAEEKINDEYRDAKEGADDGKSIKIEVKKD